MRHEILLSGKGGQGLILAGVVLAEAAGVGENREVVQTQVYGPESRGGASRSGVVVGDELILYPEVTDPDILVALSQEACERFAPTLVPNGRLLVDREVGEVHAREDVQVDVFPFTETAESLGDKILANMVALGALAASTEIVSSDAMRRAIEARTANKYHQSNLRAFEAGLALGRAK
jgi:2-oxoglutarate ferredoxin oxidoreductase subunit gamma